MNENILQTVEKASITAPKTNEELALHVLEAAKNCGVKVFCMCPGNRNSPFFHILKQLDVRRHFCFEERSAAFYCMGEARKSSDPVAVITTSGTAAGELLPAAMEAYYTGVPLLLITADRPRAFRGTGAPQSAEQVGLFSVYTPFSQDIAAGEICALHNWDKRFPAHLNVCFEEPFPCSFEKNGRQVSSHEKRTWYHEHASQKLDQFLHKSRYPLVVVSTLPSCAKKEVAEFLLKLNAPVILEGISGLREDPQLAHLRIARTEKIWHSAEKAHYPIDGILRIGGIPTIRIWRDLEDMIGKLQVCSISHLPFSGLSWGDLLHVPLPEFFTVYTLNHQYEDRNSKEWRVADHVYRQFLHALIEQEPTAEPSMVHSLSKQMPKGAHVYLGNSLPIREWDLAACNKDKKLIVNASRGVNGIDGQISTFLGLSDISHENWALIGDLTALYDMAGPWVLPQISDVRINIVVINNRGGQIFARFFPDKDFLHPHELDFEPFAHFWKMHYERWNIVPDRITGVGHRFIEMTPDAEASRRFWQRLASESF